MTKENLDLKFENYKYVRPDFEKLRADIRSLTERLANAMSSEEAIETYNELIKVSSDADSMVALAHVKNSIDTKDEFFDKEMQFIQENAPKVQEVEVEYIREFVNSKFRKELEEKFGVYLFQKYENYLLTFNPSIMEDLVEEAKVVMEYQKLLSSCSKEWNGEQLNLTQLAKYTQDSDASVRRKATNLVAEIYEEQTEKLDEIYDKLVKIRDRMAKKLGYKNFIELGYKKMGRVDYNAKDVEGYRKQIVETIVPLCNKLREEQRKRIGLDKLTFYDEPIFFKSGNPAPHGEKDWMLERAEKMYSELSPETKEFFNFMKTKDLFDLDAKSTKAAGGYCTYLRNWRSPFIFANFNGTTHDVEVLTHEAGHAFQVFSSRDYIPEYTWPGMESAEIHSMSMEFFTWPWMDLFFEEEADKFRYKHITHCLMFLPYGALVDEFQHVVYENPELSPKERREKYRELEKKYLPHRDYDGIKVLEEGGFWFRQRHIYQMPFYYIDYTLAQVCAFQFWNKDRKDHKTAFADYLRLCKTGGTKPFLQLLEVAKLENPFIYGTIKKAVEPIEEYLNSVDASKF